MVDDERLMLNFLIFLFRGGVTLVARSLRLLSYYRTAMGKDYCCMILYILLIRVYTTITIYRR